MVNIGAPLGVLVLVSFYLFATLFLSPLGVSENGDADQEPESKSNSDTYH